MSLLGLSNIIIFQWLFIRLTKCQEKRIEEFNLTEVSLMPDGSSGIGGTGDVITYQWYGFQFWVVPLTGWRSDFIYLKKKNFIKITKEREQ